MTYVIGVDLGGTKIRALILDVELGQSTAVETIATRGEAGPVAILQDIAKLCSNLCESRGITLADVMAIGLGWPSVIDYENGRTLLTPNIPGDWYQRPVEAELGALVPCPVFLLNDARSFTLAEATLGAGKGYPVVACFTLGTGIGGGVAIDGKLHLGLDGNAGEFGHSTVNVFGEPDGSGVPGAIEAYGTGPLIAAAAVKAVMQKQNTILGQMVDYNLNAITPHTVMQAAKEGDAIALRILDDAGRYIGAGVANVITILAPHCIVFGGGVSALGDWILNPIRKYMAVYNQTVQPERITLAWAQLGENAGAIGAALWAHQRAIAEQ